MFAWRSNVTGLYSMSHKGKQLYCYTVHVIHCTNKPNTRTLAHKHLTCLTALFSRVRLHKKLGHSTKRYSQTTVPKNYDTWWPFGPNCPNKNKNYSQTKMRITASLHFFLENCFDLHKKRLIRHMHIIQATCNNR